MKKVFDSFRSILAIITTVILTFVIVFYVIFLNAKSLASKKGMVNLTNNIDIVNILKDPKMGTTWDSITNLGSEIGLTEEQMEKILNNNKIKDEVATYLSDTLHNLNSNQNLENVDTEKLIDAFVEEYNSVSDKKITDEKKDILTDYVETKFANVVNEKLSTNSLLDKINSKYTKITQLINKILFGNYDFIILLVIFGLVILIVLFIFSYYKWMPYVATGTIMSSLMLLCGNLLLSNFKVSDDVNLLFTSIKDVVIANIYKNIFILFIIGILLIIVYYVIKYIIKKRHGEMV